VSASLVKIMANDCGTSNLSFTLARLQD